MTYDKTPQQKYYEANKAIVIARAKEWKKRNREKVLAEGAAYRQTHAEQRAEYSKRTAAKNNERAKRNYLENTEKRKAYAKAYYERTKEQQKARRAQYRIENRDQIRDVQREYHKNRLDTDVVYKLKNRYRRRVHHALNGIGSKSARTMELLGCTGDFLRGYLEAKFKDGMSWSNYGSWHIDHIIPLAKFNLIDPLEQKKAFHYSNLQPLWALDNRMKGAKVLGLMEQ